MLEPVGPTFGGDVYYRPILTWTYTDRGGSILVEHKPPSDFERFAEETLKAISLGESLALVDSIIELARQAATVEVKDPAGDARTIEVPEPAPDVVVYMERWGNLRPELTTESYMLESADLRAEARTIKKLRDLLEMAEGVYLDPHNPSADRTQWDRERWRIPNDLNEGIRRYVTIGVAPAESRPALVVLVANSPFGIAYLSLANRAQSMSDRSEGGLGVPKTPQWVHCANDRCNRAFPKVGKARYCPSCRETGAATAHQRRRQRAALRV